MNYFSAIFIFVVMGIIYAVVYYLNHQIKRPDNCADISDMCANCQIASCELRQKEEK